MMWVYRVDAAVPLLRNEQDWAFLLLSPSPLLVSVDQEKMKLLVLLCFALLPFLVCADEFIDPWAKSGPTVRVEAEGVRCRRCPRTDCPIVRTFKNGAKVNIICNYFGESIQG
jgi:hypothetical protein